MAKKLLGHFLLLFLFLFSLEARSNLTDLFRLQKAYPNSVKFISPEFITWNDDTKMPIHDDKENKTQQEKLTNPSLYDQINGINYIPGIPPNPSTFKPKDDPGRIRYEPFFRKMYGNTEQEVQKNLTTIYWMPKVFGNRYPLQVTTVNNVDLKLKSISTELEDLVSAHPEYRKYLENPGGTFKWRVIANTQRLSAHSFGMTIDINTNFSNYWQWDLEHEGKTVSEDTPLTYRNSIPWEIVPIFEKYGFIWGGKWHHYDTMHFEYRPELLVSPTSEN